MIYQILFITDFSKSITTYEGTNADEVYKQAFAHYDLLCCQYSLDKDADKPINSFVEFILNPPTYIPLNKSQYDFPWVFILYRTIDVNLPYRSRTEYFD